MERLLSVLRQQVIPYWVVVALNSGSAKVIGIHIGAEPVALGRFDAVRILQCDSDVGCSQNMQPNALSGCDRGQRNSFPYHY